MSLVVVLKFFHFLSIIFAGGIVVGGAVVQRAHFKAGEAPAMPVMQAMRILGLLGLGALILLWITGFGLAHALYGGLGINTAFGWKLLGAALLLASSAIGNLHMYRSAQAKQPPNAVLMGRLLTVGRLSLLLVLISVSLAFTG